jgi:fructose-1,6-bisphosphatase II / sedoheptulose-1,7-bisphosphatase
MANACAVIAFAPRGGLLHAPDTYMDKLACGPGFEDGIIDMDKPADENAKALAKAKGCRVEDIGVCVLDRPRHAEIISALRKVGCRVHLITDGDVAGVINCTKPETGIDMYVGQGGAPEGVLAAAAMRCIGGQIQGRLIYEDEAQRERAAAMGLTDPARKFSTSDLARGDVMFAATGVTTGPMLAGVRRDVHGATTHSIVMRSKTGTVRYVEAHHHWDRKPSAFRA